MLVISNLYKRYKRAEHPSVDGLTCEFSEGEITGILGPNGAGKTTTISIICGLIDDYEGNISYHGANIKTNQTLSKHIGVVPQQIALYPTLSCKENLEYFGALQSVPDHILKKRIEQLLQRFGLYEHAHKRIQHYSGGMKRRANIIASLLNEPSLLILDEPTAGVDVHSRKMILDFLNEYNQQGHSILYTSHLLDEAEELCHKVVIMDHGKALIQGTPSDIKKELGAVNLEDAFIKLTGTKLRDA